MSSISFVIALASKKKLFLVKFSHSKYILEIALATFFYIYNFFFFQISNSQKNAKKV